MRSPLRGSAVLARCRYWTAMTIEGIIGNDGPGMDPYQGPESPVHSSAKRHGCQRPSSALSPAPPGAGPVSERAGADRAGGGGDQPRRAPRHPAGLPAGGDRQPEELSREHGGELSEQAFAYIARALSPELRGFDRIGRPSDSELVLLLPGADGPRSEMVARRVLDRLRTIKVEAEGMRTAAALLGRARRLAQGRERGGAVDRDPGRHASRALRGGRAGPGDARPA